MTARAAAAHEAIQDDFAAAVLDGLSRPAKSIPCRFFYDARGSALFEEITRLPEYYPTRTEIGLLEAHAGAIADLAGPGRALVEFGSGSSRKTRILIEALPDLAAYVPIDIAADALDAAANELAAHYPGLAVTPVHADFTQGLTLPRAIRDAPLLGFFPGSTIGNFTRAGAQRFLARAAHLLGPEGALLIGVDLDKAEAILLPAYDDPGGVTAAFNLNLLARVNRELGGDLDLSAFAHEAVYNARAGRIEINIVSLADQEATILGRPFRFAAGERVHTENSHKYTLDGFANLARAAGWRPVRAWTDPDGLFSLHYLAPAG